MFLLAVAARGFFPSVVSGASLVEVRGLLAAVASLVSEHGL